MYTCQIGRREGAVKILLKETQSRLQGLPKIRFLNKANNAAHFNRRIIKGLETRANVSVSNRCDDSFGKVRACIAQTDCTYNFVRFSPGKVLASVAMWSVQPQQILIQPFVVVAVQKMGCYETPFGTLHTLNLVENVW